MKLARLLQRTVVLAASIATIAAGGERASLTIGGCVPAMKRVAAVTSRPTAKGQSIMVLLEQNSSALAYSVTVESKTPNEKSNPTPASRLQGDSQPVNLTTNHDSLSCTPNPPDRPTAPRILEFALAPTRSDAVLVFTIASQ